MINIASFQAFDYNEVMYGDREWLRFGLTPALALLALAGCASASSHPCTRGGQAARDTPFRGTIRCYQKKDRSGEFYNEGKFEEWYTNGQKALEGEYKEGKKTGKWIEWDKNGNRISERYFEDGVEIPARLYVPPKN